VTAASAQSTVTLSGTYRFAYQKDLSTAYNSATSNKNIQQLGGSGTTDPTTAANNATREGKGWAVTDANLKLAAVEDLGGGLKASFDYLLETGAFRGAAVTRADSGIGVSGGFGAIAMRNTRNSDLIASIGSAAINLPDGLYDNSGIISRGAIDTVSYTSPTISGFTGSITYVELNDGAINLAGTNAVPANTSAYVLGGAYANGPLMVTAAYKTAPADKTATTGITPKANVELAVTYDLGVAKVAFAHDGASAEGTSSAAAGTANLINLSQAEARAIANAQTKAGNGFSVTVPLGAVTVGMNYFKRDVIKLTEFGVSYAFSKRTSAGFSTGTKSGLTETQGYKGTQYRAGLTHTF
jgi:hypothetical protein